MEKHLSGKFNTWTRDNDVIRMVKDRVLWSSMTVDTLSGHGT